jgi:hypothetical protein
MYLFQFEIILTYEMFFDARSVTGSSSDSSAIAESPSVSTR